MNSILTPRPISKLATILLLSLVTQICMSQGGLLAEYYDGKDFDKKVSQQYVGNIDNTWYDEPPVPGIDPHNCSIRWTGGLQPAKTATYLFSAIVDDGIRVWIDGEIIINQWNLNDVGVFSGKKLLVAGEKYDIKVEYFNALREGEIKLQWAMEKSKEDQSWYERVFGVDYQYQIIHSDYFVPSDPPLSEVEPEQPQTTPATREEPTPAPPQQTKVQSTPPTATVQPVAETDKEVMTIVKAEKYIPKNVQFERTTADILPSSTQELDDFATFMIDHPQVTVTIEGHTDAVGIESQNQFLSERRANRIARYLVEKGIAGSRIKTVGYGGSRPLKVPAKGEYYPPNRRVVFLLAGLD